MFFSARRELNKKIDEQSSEQDKVLYSKIITHPAIADLLFGSKELVKKIEILGYFIDAFGKKHTTKEISGEGKILHFILTSYEKALTRPIYETAFETSYFEVIIDQHDGLTLSFHKNLKGDPAIKEKILADLKTKVDNNAKRIGINTELEYKG